MKFKGLFVVIMFASFQAFAGEVPAGTPPSLSNPAFWDRCGNSRAEDVQGCLDFTRTLTSQCLSNVDRQWALDHSLGVVCMGTIVHSVCPCSCFDQSTRILSVDSEGQGAWTNVLKIRKGQKVVALTEEAGLRDLKYAVEAVSYQTSGPEKKPLVVIHAGRNTLKVTETHAIVLADGKVVAAKDLVVGDSVLGVNGKSKKISSIQREYTDKNVINFLVSKPLKDKKSHIVGAEGILVGDMQWQNHLSRDLNKVLLRR